MRINPSILATVDTFRAFRPGSMLKRDIRLYCTVLFDCLIRVQQGDLQRALNAVQIAGTQLQDGDHMTG